MKRRAVLFDIGGPIDTEIAWEALMDELIRGSVGRRNQQKVSDAAYAAAWRRAIDSHAPNASQAVVWELLDQDGEEAAHAWSRIAARARAKPALPECRPGIADLLLALRAQGVVLALAANQPAQMLAEVGLLQLFDVRGVPKVIDLRKPDPRFFLHVTAALGLQPEECVMVGDRIDNDIAPARGLGMGTMLFRTGRHARQRPRSWLEVPDVVVWDVDELRVGLMRVLQGDGYTNRPSF